MARTKVQSELIATNAISGTIIADNAITATHIATNAISGTLVQDSGITTTMIASNNVTAAKIVSDGVETRHLHSNVISGQSAVTAVGTDYVLIGDTSDSNNLKKALISDFGVAGISSSADATAITIDSSENATFSAGVGVGAAPASTVSLHIRAPASDASNYAIDACNASGNTRFLVDGSGTQKFYGSDNAETARFTDGKLGIGTTSPSQALHVVGAIKVSDGIINSGAAGSASIFNDDGTTADFRVESDSNTHMLFVDGGLNRVGIGTASPASLLHINGSGDAIRVESTNAGAGGAQVDLLHYTASPADDDVHGVINFGGYYSGTTSAYGSAIKSVWSDVSAKEAELQFFTRDDSDFANRMTIDKDGKVGIGITAPFSPFHVNSEGAPDTSGNMTSGLIVSNGVGGNAIKIGVHDSGALNYIQSGYVNNANVARNFAIFSGASEALRIDTSGNVGIGTTNPTAPLYVSGNAVVTGNIISTGDTNIIYDSDDNFLISTANGTERMRITSAGNFGFGTASAPLTFFEIQKNRPDVNAPADYELKLTLNTYGYVGSGYKLGMIQFVGGDTASAQDNFYAGISAKAWNGANTQEDGALQFHVRSDHDSDTLAVEIIGENDPSNQVAGSGSVRNGMLFQWQGIAIDRSWNNNPGIAVLNASAYSTTASTQAEFRFHGTNGSHTSYPQTSGSDFSVDVRTDGSYVTGSDRRRKTNITTISSALSKVKQLTGKRFQTINRQSEINQNRSMADNYEFGFIAQEIESIIPESLKYHKDEDDGTENWNSAYSMNYASVVPLLVNAIKEQDTVIQDLKSRIETLEG